MSPIGIFKNKRNTEQTKSSLKLFVPNKKSKVAFTLAEVFLTHFKNNRKYAFTLAEVFSTHFKNNRKYAFTLAEVLITLGIIGVVAALTLPGLIQNYQRKVWSTQLKVTYSILSDGFKRILAADDTSDFSNTELASNLEGSGCSFYDGAEQCDEKFLNYLTKYFIATYVKDQHYKLKKLSGQLYGTYDGHILRFQNGSALVAANFSKNNSSYRSCQEVKQEGGNLCESSIWLRVDVNGHVRGPNTLGRDVFEFVVSPDGIIYPNYGKDTSIFEGRSNYYWRNNSILCSNGDDSSGLGCAGRIMENSWNMDY